MIVVSGTIPVPLLFVSSQLFSFRLSCVTDADPLTAPVEIPKACCRSRWFTILLPDALLGKKIDGSFSSIRIALFLVSPVLVMTLLMARLTSSAHPCRPFSGHRLAVLAVTEGKTALAALLVLTYAIGARACDVLQFAVEDVDLTDTALEASFRRGKGVAFRGPYTVHGAIADDVHRNLVKAQLSSATGRWIWPTPTPQQRAEINAELLRLIRKHRGPGMRQASIHRGALQHMVRCGATEEQVMHFSGYTKKATLHRYLGWNKISATRAIGTANTA